MVPGIEIAVGYVFAWLATFGPEHRRAVQARVLLDRIDGA